MATSWVCKEIEFLRDAVDALCSLDAFTISSPDAIIELETLSSRFEYIKTKAFAEFDASGEWKCDGAKTPVAWLDARCHSPKPEAWRRLRRARALAHLPVMTAAFAKGEIGAAQVDALVKERTEFTQESLAENEALLVGYATRMKFERFCTVLAYWAEDADPMGAERSEAERKARRAVSLYPNQNTMFYGRLILDAESGTIVSDELRRLEEELFEEDWAEATARLGRDPKYDELARTSSQRSADALVEMALRSRSTPPGAQRPEPLISLLVGYEELYGRICRIQGGPVVTPGSVLKHLDGATFERIVFAQGKRVECSPKFRFFTGATRRAIEVRDQECAHEYCDRPAEHCQIDHIVPWADGGLTEQENGRPLCAFHNRLRNHGPPTSPPKSGHHGPEPGDSP
jgi:Domain of unknown function (DUF222)/HNH endonuclease